MSQPYRVLADRAELGLEELGRRALGQRIKISDAHRGRELTPEWRQKISAGMRRYWANRRATAAEQGAADASA